MVMSFGKLLPEQYVGFYPWVWVEFESSEPPSPFPFLGGVDPAVVVSLHDVHQRLSGAIDIAISDVFAGRASCKDPSLRQRLENAYAEVVHSRPHVREHIHCGRDADGAFHWEFPLDATKSATIQYSGLRVCNAMTQQAVPFAFDPQTAPAIGRILGCLDGTQRVLEIGAEIDRMGMAFGAGFAKHVEELLELLMSHECLSITAQTSIQGHWLDVTQDQDVIHLGHAALMYRHNREFFLFDPWLIPWFAEAPVPSLWTSLLPKPAAIFLTHDHDDHVDPRTLLAFPKETPVIVPSRANRRELYFDYQALLHGLGFTQVIELAHGETWKFDGGGVVSVPFYGECSCELGMPRNCYLIADRGYNVFIPVDSGPTNSGKSILAEGVVEDLVRQYGAIGTIFEQPGQLLELRTFAAYACLSHPGRWLEVGENCCVTSEYVADLAEKAGAGLFVAYANGGAEWLPDHPVFVFSGRNQALREMITAHWWPLEELKEKLAAKDCRLHQSRAMDLFRKDSDGTTLPVAAAAPQPMELYLLDHPPPPFGG